MNYIAIGPYCWGKAKTVKDAVKNAKKNYPTFLKSKDWSVTVYECHRDTTVNELGGLSYPRPHKPVKVAQQDRGGRLEKL